MDFQSSLSLSSHFSSCCERTGFKWTEKRGAKCGIMEVEERNSMKKKEHIIKHAL
jgi:hypothetical protein